jgi:hypothetical protein
MQEVHAGGRLDARLPASPAGWLASQADGRRAWGAGRGYDFVQQGKEFAFSTLLTKYEVQSALGKIRAECAKARRAAAASGGIAGGEAGEGA